MARPRATTDDTDTELRDLLLVVRRALLLVDSWWENFSGGRFPKSHPYRQATRMVICYIEGRYTDR